MALIVTPGRLNDFSEFYHQLASMTSAGLGVMQALQQLERSPPARSFREPIRRLSEQLARGATFSEGLAAQPGWLPTFDLALLEAGEQSGRLDICCRLLADYYRERSRLARQTLSDLAYPIFLLHAMVFIKPTLSLLFGSTFKQFASETILMVCPLYLVAFLLVFACQGRHGEKWRGRVESLLGMLPMVGTARRNLALARLAAALEALLSAGVHMIQAWELAAGASGSPALRKAVLAWHPELERGSTSAELLQRTRQFPEMFANMYSTGEVSGTLDDTLKRLNRLYQEEGARKLKAACELAPRLVYLIVAVAIAASVLKGWQKYFDEVNRAIGQ
jgi:type II secretory pathway component PulF